METVELLILFEILYITHFLIGNYKVKRNEEKKFLKEYREFFSPKPAKTVEEVEEWCQIKFKNK